LKILIENSSSLTSFLCSLPLVKGLTDLFPEAEICYKTNSQYKEFQEYAPYIHSFVGIEEVMNNDFDIRIDLENWKIKGSALLEENIKKIPTQSKIHLVDKYLAILPSSFQKRSFVLKETLAGFEKIKEVKNTHYDLVIYPFSQNDSAWRLKEYDLFIRYYLQMNPNKKILVVGLDPHSEMLTQYFSSKDYYQRSVDLRIFDLSAMVSFLRRVSVLVMPASPIKYVISNPETVVIELSDCKTVDPIYKEKSYVIRFERKLINKFVYSEDEIPFDGNEHFLAYFVTSVLDEDLEKMNWLTNSYKEQCIIYNVVISKRLGLRTKPMEWSRASMVAYLAATVDRLIFHNVKESLESENFYYDLHDDTELSQDQIIYELAAIHKEVKKLKAFFERENAFSHYLKLKNYDVKRFEGILIKSILDHCPEGQFYAQLVKADRFLTDILNVSSQKLLENMSMTSDFYS
jgi:hypothetical protein